jgi:hypothetical protein
MTPRRVPSDASSRRSRSPGPRFAYVGETQVEGFPTPMASIPTPVVMPMTMAMPVPMVSQSPYMDTGSFHGTPMHHSL